MNVLVYSGPGVSQTSLAHAIHSLRSLLGSYYAVQTITASALACQPWASTCALLVIPGGRDQYYVEDLASAVMEIRSYVESGGSYLGLCAGAYFGSNRVEWEVGTTMGVSGNRPLRFFPGVCEGCVFKGFEYDSEAGARVVELKVAKELRDDEKMLRYIYYNGGGHFVGGDKMLPQGVVPLLRYTAEDAMDFVAAVWCSVKRGVALLCGVHTEYSLLSEPVKSCIARDDPSLSREDIIVAEESRKQAMRNMLRILRLRLPDELNQHSGEITHPYPQLLLNISSSSLSGELFLAALQHGCSRTRVERKRLVLEDQNDTFHVYSQPDISALIRYARQIVPLDNETFSSFPSVVAVCPANTFPSPLDTPLFNIPAYFSHLAKVQTALASKSKLRNQRIGELLLYGEVVTSTQTLLDKCACLSTDPRLPDKFIIIRNPTFLRSLPSPLLSLASYQLAGRGRGGNVWVAPHGCLTLSLALRLSPGTIPLTSLVFIQYLAGLAVTETCRDVMGSMGEQVRLKWPNDIYAVASGDRHAKRCLSKLGGILVSTNMLGGEVDIIVGMLQSRWTGDLDLIWSQELA